MNTLALGAQVQRRVFAQLASGALLALAGVALVETLQFAAQRPLSPLGWPGLGLLVAAALAGAPGMAGAVLVLVGYYVVTLGQPERFPEFFASGVTAISWVCALGLLSGVILIVRPLLLRAASNEAELRARRIYEAALHESEERLRVITESVPGLVAYIDADERYRFANRAYTDWFGLDRAKMLGRTVRVIWGAERYTHLRPNVERALRGERVTYDYAVNQGGVERHVLASYVPERDDAGKVKGFFVLGSDITELVAVRTELQTERERLAAALEGSSVALWDTDLRTGRVYLSEAWSAILGAPRAPTVTTIDSLMALAHPDDLEAARRLSIEAMKGARENYAVEHRVRALDGEWKWIISRGRVTERHPETGRALRMIGTNMDITERRRMEEAVQSVAQTDALTGLANRRLLTDRLAVALARSRRNGMPLAVLYLDIDRFKHVNDTLGHGAGDVLLKDFALRLRASVRGTDTVARFGGDEFVVLLEDMKDRDNATRVAEKIIAECRAPLRIDGRDFLATTSLGIAFGDGMSDADALLKRADGALYAAKSAGRDCYRVAP